MPLSPALAEWLRSTGHDALHADAAGLSNATDEEILLRAASEHRLIVTADLDFARLLALSHRTGPGLLLFRGGNYTAEESIQLLGKALGLVPENDLPHSVIIIERSRIRRRLLPI